MANFIFDINVNAVARVWIDSDTFEEAMDKLQRRAHKVGASMRRDVAADARVVDAVATEANYEHGDTVYRVATFEDVKDETEMMGAVRIHIDPDNVDLAEQAIEETNEG